MRPESELFKDKVEITLEGRQVFYLFFGGAVIASLVFVLGVMVGKRVEARAHVGDSAGTTAASDPLAALDELSGGEPGLTYPAALAAGDDVPVPVAPLDEAVEEAKKAAAAQPDAEPEPEPKPEVEAKAKPEAVAEKPPVDKKKYTLQLSSFRDRGEAEAFMAQIGGAGYKPYITEAEVDGKGTWYRVRLGSYESYDAALEAKGKFEAAQKMIAYVTRAR